MYGLRLLPGGRVEPWRSPLEVADLVVYLPAGSALWRATGGDMALTAGEHLLRTVDWRLQVLAWMQTKDGSKGVNAPKPPAPVPAAGTASAEVEDQRRRYLAHEERSARRAEGGGHG